MTRAATRSPSLASLDRIGGEIGEGAGRLHLGWAPSRTIAAHEGAEARHPAATASASRQDPPPISAARREGAATRSPKSPPPIKGQTGPRPGY